MNKTLVIIKPDGVRRKLIGKITNRFEDNDLNILAMQLMQITEKLATDHYDEHKEKDFFPNLLEFITSGPSVAMILEGKDGIIPKVREIVGATNPSEAAPGTIRGDLREDPVRSITENMVHASDSPESAKREITLFFGNEYI